MCKQNVIAEGPLNGLRQDQARACDKTLEGLDAPRIRGHAAKGVHLPELLITTGDRTDHHEAGVRLFLQAAQVFDDRLIGTVLE